ncbi:TetR/AcrR family transcriptional regulator [Streptomyces zagrosensis]|uniref:AcrR family transcriptional regulator n=1 Tax=Streptomyces zagrosensis TaxID=1042984 RepID=A0A7W9Q7K3_9ACTN|nr:TetR/AcrR family transcriptional regulator [Streptomyces zagrosensis]MBB5935078.1 AcrR family transcriptional regulator [Streptomyces zagrosensis]
MTGARSGNGKGGSAKGADERDSTAESAPQRADRSTAASGASSAAGSRTETSAKSAGGKGSPKASQPNPSTHQPTANTAQPEAEGVQPDRQAPQASDAERALAEDNPATAKPRRRQARGERRIEQLLEAASTVFTSVGYSAASTNAIAREAGVSPGTLYQFFPNKESIAVELGERLIHRLRATHGAAFAPENAHLPLAELVDTVLDPMIEFNCVHPAALALLYGTDVPGRVVSDHDALHAALLERTAELIALRAPALSTDERIRLAQMTVALFKASLELVVAHEGAERDWYTRESKAAVYRYLAPYIDQAHAGASASPQPPPSP